MTFIIDDILTIRSRRPAEIDQSSPLYWIVKVEFFDLEDLVIEGFNHQNVIQQLVQTEVNGRLGFSFNGIFGADCEFTCETARVVSVEAATPTTE